MKSVCVVGAGAAGLVAAKNLLQTSRFTVTVLEKKCRPGGMWALEPDGEPRDADTKCSPHMPTNLSHFSVSFGDFPWEDIPKEVTGLPNANASDIAMFPKAWQVGRYLKAYSKKYGVEETVRYGCTVTSATRVTGEDKTEKWKINWRSSDESGTSDAGTSREQIFDHLIVASGFFQRPREPTIEVKGPRNFSGKVIHSSQFHKLEDILPPSHTAKGTIVVVGGSISGPEASSSLAARISEANHGPESTRTYEDYKINHVLAKPVYVLPRYLPTDPIDEKTTQIEPRPHFVPLDLALYELSRRPPGPITASAGLVPSKAASNIHKGLRKAIGGTQSELSYDDLVYSTEDFPPYISVADNYSEFVRSGDIIPVTGTMVSMEVGDDTSRCSIELSGGTRNVDQSETQNELGASTTISDVVGIIYATGYSPHAALDWLSKDILDTLEYDPTSNKLPLVLGKGSFFNPAIPSLAFVGMYEGPYWGVMELQASTIAKLWTGTSPQEVLLPVQDLDTIRKLRLAITRREKSVPQAWMSDYVGFMESLSSNLSIAREGPQSGPCVPARYTTNSISAQSAQPALLAMNEALRASKESARFVAAAAFRAIQGRWELYRTIDSKLAEYPLKRYEGIGTFHPRAPTDPEYSAEYLYIENGTAYTDTGASFQTSQRYVYRYAERTDTITVWFVKKEQGGNADKTVDYLFNEMKFEPEPRKGPGATAKGWVATSDHLCVKDMYNSYCEFQFRGAQLDRFAVTYDVRGPKKDYVSETWFTRPKITNRAKKTTSFVQEESLKRFTA